MESSDGERYERISGPSSTLSGRNKKEQAKISDNASRMEGGRQSGRESREETSQNRAQLLLRRSNYDQLDSGRF